MRNLFEAQLPSPDVSNEALPSDQSKYDQEIGSNAASRSGDTLTEHAACWCCPYAMDVDLLRKVLAEALGTFILMYSICAIIAITQLMGGEVGLLEYAATAALSVVVIVFSIGAISGAHVNPSVTIAFATFGQFPWSKVPLYILAQLVGSVLATYVGKLVYGIKSELMTTRPLQGSTSAFWVELIATLLIMFLASSLAHQSRPFIWFCCWDSHWPCSAHHRARFGRVAESGTVTGPCNCFVEIRRCVDLSYCPNNWSRWGRFPFSCHAPSAPSVLFKFLS
ncbi:probable aquaporin NIP7-1 isoform X2 [Actinidia eriantha]|uniref:probable aquaporin NIP7-1 isoform X2 n=1 Tax=Actinidia eriantha TaxID=165200 RepID=UPI00258A5A0A|nr:probable aquaporin NIP7-1 isoform X2 [Actinidia eriantha]